MDSMVRAIPLASPPFLQALMLAARGTGLHTCAQPSLIDFYPVLRTHMTIPDDHVIVCGVALGYADDSTAPAAIAPPVSRSRRSPRSTIPT